MTVKETLMVRQTKPRHNNATKETSVIEYTGSMVIAR